MTRQTPARLRCAHVIASIADSGAGPTYSVSALCRHLASAGADVDLHSVESWRATEGDGAQRASLLQGVQVTKHPRSWDRVPILSAMCFSSSLRDRLVHDAASLDVVHGHGLWLMPNVYPAWACRAESARAKFIVSPRGMLGAAALTFSRRKKQAFWRLFQKSALRAAACIHATSDAELDDVRRAGVGAPVAVIPNGVELPALDARAAHGALREKCVLSLGRIHPKKGLDRLVRAWAPIEAEYPDWRLRIVGPAELNHDRELRELASSLGLTTVSIEGPAFGDDKNKLLRSADLFVLPTLNENFAMTVAEALAAETPVISTKGAPWAGLETQRCGWWIDHGVEPMTEALRQAIDIPADQRAAMGARGRDWMARDFSWERVAADMADVYRWMSGAGDRPSCIRDVSR